MLFRIAGTVKMAQEAYSIFTNDASPRVANKNVGILRCAQKDKFYFSITTVKMLKVDAVNLA